MTSTAPNGPPGWVVVLDKPAQKQLDRLPPHDFNRVDAALRSMGSNPFGGDLERLTKHDRYSFRRRVGTYRILFNVDTTTRRVRIGAVVRAPVGFSPHLPVKFSPTDCERKAGFF